MFGGNFAYSVTQFIIVCDRFSPETSVQRVIKRLAKYIPDFGLSQFFLLAREEVCSRGFVSRAVSAFRQQQQHLF